MPTPHQDWCGYFRCVTNSVEINQTNFNVLQVVSGKSTSADALSIALAESLSHDISSLDGLNKCWETHYFLY